MKSILKPVNLFVLSSLFVLSISCKKNSSGGKAEVHVKVSNDGFPIHHANAYVHFDAKQAPSDPQNNYDMMAHGEETDNHIHVEGLRPGNYYIYAVGVNTLTGKTVRGGTALSISWKERKNTLEADINVAAQ